MGRESLFYDFSLSEDQAIICKVSIVDYTWIPKIIYKHRHRLNVTRFHSFSHLKTSFSRCYPLSSIFTHTCSCSSFPSTLWIILSSFMTTLIITTINSNHSSISSTWSQPCPLLKGSHPSPIVQSPIVLSCQFYVAKKPFRIMELLQQNF